MKAISEPTIEINSHREGILLCFSFFFWIPGALWTLRRLAAKWTPAGQTPAKPTRQKITPKTGFRMPQDAAVSTAIASTNWLWFVVTLWTHFIISFPFIVSASFIFYLFTFSPLQHSRDRSVLAASFDYHSRKFCHN